MNRKIAVAGTGYVGLSIATLLLSLTPYPDSDKIGRAGTKQRNHKSLLLSTTLTNSGKEKIVYHSPKS